MKLTPDMKRRALEWLPSLPPRERHNAFSDTRVDGVGDWLLLDETFSTWHTSEGRMAKPVLLFYGGPGVGKTFMSSLVIDTLCSKIVKRDMVVSYVYCEFGTQHEQSVSSVLGSVLFKALGEKNSLKSKSCEAFEMAERQVEGFKFRLHEILEMLIESISLWNRFFICIDALDEFPTKQRAQLWESLRRIVRECPGARLFLTGRPQIREEVGKYFPTDADMVSITPTMDDVTSYIEHRLEQDLAPDGVDEEFRADILRIVPEMLSGMFLLVALKMDAILREVTVHKRRQALGRITDDLDLRYAYEKTLDRIRQQDRSQGKLGMEALMWISRSERPLNSEELCYALEVETGAEDFNTHNVLSIRTILACTLGLVTIDETALTVHLVHPTLQEYLEQHPTLFATAHSMMAEICLTYLNCRSVRALPLSPDTVLATTPFLEYATCFWGVHAAMGMTKQVKSLALRLLDGYEIHISASVLWQRKIRKQSPAEHVHGISGLHCIAFWGIAEIAISMLEMRRWDVDRRDSEGNTPLMWAVKYGNGRLVELLREHGDTESHVVAPCGHAIPSPTTQGQNKGLAKLLPENGDINPNSPDSNRRATQSYVVMEGLKSAVKVLLGSGDVNPDPSDNNGRTPPPSAGELVQEDQLKPLPECGNANPNSSDNMGRLPSPLAAEPQHQGVPKLLPEHGNPEGGSPEAGGGTTALATSHNPPGQETTNPPPSPEGVTSHATDDFPLDASNSHSTLSEAPQEQSLRCKQSPPDQSDSVSAPSTSISILSSGLSLDLILLALICFLFSLVREFS